MWVQVLSGQMVTVRILYPRRKYKIVKTKREDVVVRDPDFVQLMVGLSKSCPKFEDLRTKRMLRIPVHFRAGEFPEVVIDDAAPRWLTKWLTVYRVMTS